MNDDLLKRAGGGNYFDELLARVISAPVKRCSIVRYWRFMPQKFGCFLYLTLNS